MAFIRTGYPKTPQYDATHTITAKRAISRYFVISCIRVEFNWIEVMLTQFSTIRLWFEKT